MKLLRLIPLLLLTGCASTTIYEGGQKVLTTQGDMSRVKFATANGTTFSADMVIHSTPTLAGGQAASQVIGAVAGLAGTIGTTVVAGGVVAHSPIAAVVVPATATAVSRVSDSATATETRKQMQQGQYIKRRWDE